MRKLRQAQRPRPSAGVWWAAALSIAAAATAGCGRAAQDTMCRPRPPQDELAYRAGVLQARADKEQAYRSGEDSPVPPELRDSLHLEFYPIDLGLRLVGPLVRDARSDTFTIVSTSGKRRPIRRVGHFQLQLAADVERLPVYQLLDLDPESAGHLFVPFMDATSVVETYPAGRYLEVEEIEPGRFVIDFNLAYNPLCAYGGTFNCPITPAESRLRAAIRAGEKGYYEGAPGVAATSDSTGRGNP